jgi:alcohol dehydrogenase
MNPEARAAVFDGPGRPLTIRSFPLPEPGEGELLVRVRLATICGSDLHTVEGRRVVPCPSILGHETVGTVAALPAGPTPVDFSGHPLALGDRIVWSVLVHCGNCFFCTADLPQKCEHLFKYGHESLGPDGGLHGGLATHCVLKRGTVVLRVPPGLPDAVAAPAGCATATVAAALRHAGDLAGRSVLVQGAGLLGLTAAAWARQRRASHVIVCDVHEQRLGLARTFGATHVLQADAPDIRQRIRDLTDGRGVDVALEMSGAVQAVLDGIEALRYGGHAVWIGSVFPAQAPGFCPERVVRKHLTIHGVHNYRPDDLQAALAFLASHHERYPFANLVSRPYPLDAIAEAFTAACGGTVTRVAVSP